MLPWCRRHRGTEAPRAIHIPVVAHWAGLRCGSVAWAGPTERTRQALHCTCGREVSACWATNFVGRAFRAEVTRRTDVSVATTQPVDAGPRDIRASAADVAGVTLAATKGLVDGQWTGCSTAAEMAWPTRELRRVDHALQRAVEAGRAERTNTPIPSTIRECLTTPVSCLSHSCSC